MTPSNSRFDYTSRRLWFVCAVIAAACAISARGSLPQNLPGDRMRMTVKPSATDPLELDLVFEHSNDADLETYSYDLPWGGENSIILRAVKARGVGFDIEPCASIDDPGIGTETIPRGKVMKGSIKLKTRFPTIAEAAADSDVVIFWSYQLKNTKNVAMPRVGGFVLIPRIGDKEKR